MQTLQARIDSFQKTRRIKRYPGKPSSSTASVKWPHPPDFKANANTLAEAGFYFTPGWDDRDGVTCFLCGKELSDWDANDDPFEIHYTKCKSSCAWAVVRCGLTEDLDQKGRFVFQNKTRLPFGKAMEKARLETFGKDWWPHDDELSHGATVTKMAQAGFVYTPQAAGDDTVTCLYCNLSLGGWEMEDDPAQEHRTRSSKPGSGCPFLSFSSKQARSKHAQPSSTAKKPPNSDKGELSEGESTDIRITDPPPPRAKRGKARPMSSAASSKPRRKTRATRGKSTSVLPRSPSPSQAVSRDERGTTSVADTSMDVDILSTGGPGPDPASGSLPPNNDPHRDTSATRTSGSLHSSPVRPGSPPRPSQIVSLSHTEQPIIADSQLTDHEGSMSLEQWIRQEIDVSYGRLLNDGRRQIELFKAKAAELRKRIDEL